MSFRNDLFHPKRFRQKLFLFPWSKTQNWTDRWTWSRRTLVTLVRWVMQIPFPPNHSLIVVRGSTRRQGRVCSDVRGRGWCTHSRHGFVYRLLGAVSSRSKDEIVCIKWWLSFTWCRVLGQFKSSIKNKLANKKSKLILI